MTGTPRLGEVMAAGKSFAIMRAIMAESCPDGPPLSYESSPERLFASRPGHGIGSTPLTMTGGS